MDFHTAPMALVNKTILITGSGDGIGKQLAITMAAQGATIILLGRTVSKLEGVYDQIVSEGYPQPAIVPLDLSGATSHHYQDLCATIIDQFGQLDGLILNAGLLGELRPFEQIPDDEFDAVMQVNLTSQFKLIKALIPAMRQAPSASVLFTSSGVGRKGRAYWGSYAISKFATEGMMQVLADEYSSSTIRFNAINPGPTATDMRAKAYPAEDPSTLKTPAQITQPYVFFMADCSNERNGYSIDAQSR